MVVSKNSIIRDKIKKTEILNFVKEVKVEDKFLMNLLKSKYSQIEFSSIINFENYLKENDLNVKLIKEKFAIELIWNDLVFQKYNSKISIDREKVKSEILNKPKKNLRELSISEIIFNVSKKSEIEKKYGKIVEDIELTGFKNAALIHSISDSASIGGYIGWIKEDNLNEKIRTNSKQHQKPCKAWAAEAMASAWYAGTIQHLKYSPFTQRRSTIGRTSSIWISEMARVSVVAIFSTRNLILGRLVADYSSFYSSHAPLVG